MNTVIWVGLALLGYWYVVKGGTAAQLTTAIRNKLSNFCAVNQAGLPTGALSNPGSHDSFPGACITPLGITSEKFAPADPPLGTVATQASHQISTGVRAAPAPKRVRPPVIRTTVGGIPTRVY